MNTNYIIKTQNDYNGWSNYATWRINMEIFSDMDYKDLFDAFPNVEMLEDYVEHLVFDHHGKMGLMEDYARAFLNNVNYHEILEHIQEDYEYDKTAKNEE